MMAIEKKLALADLKTYQQDQNLRTLAKDIVRYQLFRVKSVIHKLSGEFTATTKYSYFKVGVRYIKDGSKKPRISHKLYDFIDEAIQQCVQPLTPSKQDRAREYKRRQKVEVKQPQIDVPQQLTQPFEYGIRKDDKIIVMKDDHAANEFLNNCRSLGIDGVRLITLTVEEEEY